MIQFTSDEIRHIAGESAKLAVREMLVAMGANAEGPDALIEMQKDFAHIRKWRQSVEAVQTRGLMVAVGIIVTGIAGAIWMAVRGAH